MMNQNLNAEQTRILSRVRKMMNLANDAGATSGERDNALRMAHATLAKYNLELSDATSVAGKTSAADEPRVKTDEVFLGTIWARQIAAAAAKLFFCMYFYSKLGPNTDNAKHYFVGRHSNVVTAQEMAKYLIASVHREAKAYQKSVGGTWAQYRSFATGAMVEIHHRCEELRAASSRPAPVQATQDASTVDRSMSLAVVYKDEEEANRQFLATTGTTLGKARATRSARMDWEARQSGAQYGKSVSLNRQVK